jgi:NAD(P)-dependent dehydrogenase (short-subunit alcohol dehydrogenase family)
MRVRLHGSDEGLEAALRARGVELVADGPADALLTVVPRPALAPLAEIDPDEWAARFRARVEEPFWAFQAWLRALLERGAAGRWVAVTTVLGAQPFPGGGADGASAVALQTLVRIAAVEYGPRGLRANAVAAGWRESDLPGELDPELARDDTPTGRLGSDADVAAAVAWLLSDDASQVNGEVLRVDGGYAITRGARPDPRRT